MTGRVLILRPEPGASASLRAARALGLEAESYPLFMVAALPWTGPEPHLVEAVMLTSANAVVHGGPQLERYRHLPAYAVGEATAQAARAAGFADVRAGGAGVQALVEEIEAHGHREILHISGRDVRLFDPRGLRVASACVYAAVDSGNADDLIARLRPETVVLVHSPRAGGRLDTLVPRAARGGIHLVAISPAALAAAGMGWASAVAADHADDKAMLALAARLCV